MNEMMWNVRWKVAIRGSDVIVMEHPAVTSVFQTAITLVGEPVAPLKKTVYHI